jgi:hypothetical protein
MSTHMLKPVTNEELAYVRHVAPDLMEVGLLRCYWLPDDPNSFPATYPISDPHLRGQVMPARRMIRAACDRTRSINYTLPCHELCKDATHWLSTQPYVGSPIVSNGAFIAGAILEGYPIEVSGSGVYFPLLFTPEYERLRRLRLSMEAKAADRIARRKLLQEVGLT